MNAVASGVKDLTKQWLVILTGHVWTGMRWAKELTREVEPDSGTAHRVRIMSNSKYKLDISCPSSIGNETYNLQGRHGEFEPGKVQYSTPNFFDRLYLIRAYWSPKSR